MTVKHENLSLPEKVLFYRKRSGCSARYLDRIAHLDEGTIDMIESGALAPDPRLIEKISTALELDSKEMLLLMGINFYQ